MTVISFGNQGKELDGFEHGLFKQPVTTQKSLVLSIQKSFLIFKCCVYPVKVSEGLFLEEKRAKQDNKQ